MRKIHSVVGEIIQASKQICKEFNENDSWESPRTKIPVNLGVGTKWSLEVSADTGICVYALLNGYEEDNLRIECHRLEAGDDEGVAREIEGFLLSTAYRGAEVK